MYNNYISNGCNYTQPSCCGSTTQPNNCTQQGDCAGGTVVGSWNLNIKCYSDLNCRLVRCFQTTVSNQIGVMYKILLYLGCQIVDGTNYAFLCTETTVTNPPTSRLVVVVINRDLEGNCTLVSVEPVLQ